MSLLKDRELFLENKLNIVLENKYNIYKEIQPDGYLLPCILLISHYSLEKKTSENKVELRIKTDCFMMIDSPKGFEQQAKEELQKDLEKVLSLSEIMPNDEVFIEDNFNKNSPTKSADFSFIE